jgi:ribosomal protein L20
MRPGRKGNQSASQAASQLVVLPRVAAPQFADPIAVDVNDDGEPDGFFTPNEMQFFGAGKKRRPSSSPWIAHVKAYAKQHGMKYGDALKEAKATYTRGAGSKAKWGDHNKAHKSFRYDRNHNDFGQRVKFQPKDKPTVYRLDSGKKVSADEYWAAEEEKRRQYIADAKQRQLEERQAKQEQRQANPELYPTRQERREANQAAKAAAAQPAAQQVASPVAAQPTAPPTAAPVVGAGKKRGPSSSPWIAHVKAYARQHGMKYGDALKYAKATYKRGGALYPAGYTP